MEFIICMILAALLGAGRLGVDGIHAAKGTTPPHLERARLKAQRESERRAAKENRALRPGEDLPTFGDLARVWRRQAWQDAIDYRTRRAAEKRGTATEPTSGSTTPSPKGSLRKTWGSIKKFGLLMWRPVGETKDDAVKPEPDKPEPIVDEKENTMAYATKDEYLEQVRREAPTHCGKQMVLDRGADPGQTVRYRCEVCGGKEHGRFGEKVIEDIKDAKEKADVSGRPTAQFLPAGGGVTGEAANYETAIVELDRIEVVQRGHLESAMAALKSLQDAKHAISDSQATYRPAAEATGMVHEQLTSLNLDSETVSQTGTMADSMPPNAVDAMFEQLEEMEAAAQAQVGNAEAALASTIAARAVIVEKYGDAHNTVQSELAGDSRFLSGTGAHAA